MKKIFATLTLALAMIGSAFAQTQYSTSKFSAAFNSSVTVNDLGPNDAKTGSTIEYESSVNDVLEIVAVRTINAGSYVDVNSTTAEYYAQQQLNGKGMTLVTRTSKDKAGNDQTTYQGHPFSYICTEFDNNGVKYWMRTRFIVVDSNTVLFVQMVSPADKSDRDEWTRFEFSLNIN
jgi:hypothetical protein